MTTSQRFSPLCDVHHTPMQRMMVEEDADEVCSYHACERRDCTRIFRGAQGYLDVNTGGFDESRVSLRPCPVCGFALYLAAVDHCRKIETWECPQLGCDYSEEDQSPSAR